MRGLWLMAAVVTLPLLLTGCETDGTDEGYSGASAYTPPDNSFQNWQQENDNFHDEQIERGDADLARESDD